MRRARWLCAITSAALLGSILLAVPAGAGGGGCYPDPSQDVTAARVSGAAGQAIIDMCAFEPTVLYVDEGAEVTWVNKDPVHHTVTGAYVGWGSEQFLGQGDTITQRFGKAGVFPFYCLLHPGMVGTVVVGDPDPSTITEEVSKIGSTGIELGADDSGEAAAPDAAPAPGDEPASESLPSSLLLATIVVLGLSAAVGFTLVRRRGRLEQSV
jgi:plastocyanin